MRFAAGVLLLANLKGPADAVISASVNATRADQLHPSEPHIRPTSRPTFVFLAGVEGSGHHFLETVATSAVSRGQASIRINSTAPGLGNILPHSWQCGKVWSRSDYPRFVETLRSRAAWEHGVHVLPAKYSYPMCGLDAGDANVGRMNGSYSPRLDWMQEAADEAGVVLLVMFLYRDLEECLASNCLHRSWESCSDDAYTIKRNSEIMRHHLLKVPSENLFCHKYGDTVSMTNAVRSVFGDAIAEDVDETFTESMPNDGRIAEAEWPSYVESLEGQQTLLQELCESSQQVSSASLLRRILTKDVKKDGTKDVKEDVTKAYSLLA